MWLCFFLLLGIPAISPPLTEGRETLPILEKQLKNWTDTFGQEIFNFGNIVTKYPDIQRRFQTSPNSDIKRTDMQRTVSEMANDTYVILKEKVDAIRKIMNWAEQKALEHYEKPEDLRKKPPETYLNAKKVNYNPPIDMSAKELDAAVKFDPLLKEKLTVKQDEHFGGNVNLTHSCVHVASSVFDRREDVLDGIDWSSGMDEVFRSNYKKNPTLLWQYFGSSTGFFRQYPAIKWPNDNTNKNYPDMFDCRTRPWYTAAANSPKNMIILQDVSGSMMGLRREIARHVVYTILDTLTDNDYVSVLNFTDVTLPVVPCYKDRLVQANLENIREFKVALDQDRTIGMSNFTEALLTAFHILEKHRDSNRSDSANCNEAIMLITDGAPETFVEVFDPKNTDPPGRTRVFTYLIGRDVTDTREVLQIACSNKGYFSHVTTLGQVQEQVLKYLAVMSRPMVMARDHSVTWTPAYADIVEIAESDWLWEEKNREKQRQRSNRYKSFLKRVGNETEGQEFYVVAQYDDTRTPGKREAKRIAGRRVSEYLDYGITNPSEEELREMFAQEERMSRTHQAKPRTREPKNLSSPRSHPRPPRAEAITAKKQHEILLARKAKHDAEQDNLAKWGPNRKFRFMISVSLPVFDQRNTTETMMSVNKEQANETHTVVEPVKEKIAIFLGVVGTDIPIVEIQKVASSFKAGVNGYTFATTENGYILFHPEWRPLLTDLLKPNYNAVDLTEIELIDSDLDRRNVDAKLMEMRRDMMDIQDGDAHNRSHSLRVPQDDFKRVKLRKQRFAYAKIPNTTYTLVLAIPESLPFKFHGEIELRRDGHGKNVTQFFEVPGELRKWKVNPDWTYCEYIRGDHPEFRAQKEDLVLHFLREIQKAKTSWAWRNTGVGLSGVGVRHSSMGSDIYSCDKELVQSLVFDANVTGVFNLKWLRSFTQNDSPFAKIYTFASFQIVQKFGAVVAFIATRSGLTRWVNYTYSQAYEPFSHSDIRATEELWYKRAVDRYEVDRSTSYVVSVPYDAGTRPDSLVTATRAIFVHRNGPGGPNHRFAPVAVAGVQFEHEKLVKRFMEVASVCDGSGCLTCRSKSLDCYVIDENGYIVISADHHEDTGRFLGEVDGAVMEQLQIHGIYKKVRVVDYQAICFHLVTKSGFGSILNNPFKSFRWIVRWFIGRMAWLALQVNLHSYFSPDFSSVLASAIVSANDEQELVEDNPNWHPYLELASINKTRLRPCHKEYFLYSYGPKYLSDLFTTGYHPGILHDCNELGHHGFFGVHLINRTNLIMVAVDGKCKRQRKKISLKPKEVVYELEEELENMTAQNHVIAQICRKPLLSLDRKRPTATCLYYNEYENDLRRDCGLAMDLQSSTKLTLLSIIFIIFRYIRIL